MAFSFRKLFSPDDDDYLEPDDGSGYPDDPPPQWRTNQPVVEDQDQPGPAPVLLSESTGWRSRHQAYRSGESVAAEVSDQTSLTIPLSRFAQYLPLEALRPGIVQLPDIVDLGQGFFGAQQRPGFYTTTLLRIFQLMPELFVRDISPSEDMAISIPEYAFESSALPAIAAVTTAHAETEAVQGTSAVSPFQMASPTMTASDQSSFGTQSQSPRSFGGAAPTSPQGALPQPRKPGSSPFGGDDSPKPPSAPASPPPTQTDSPFGGGGSGGSPPAPAPSNGPGLSESPFRNLASTGGNTGSASPASSPFHNQPAPSQEEAVAPQAETPQEAEADGEISLSLHKILRSVTHADLGFDPSKVPSHVRVDLPLGAVRNQLPTGRVELPISKIAEGCEERYRPAFAKAKTGLLVNVPLQEIFHNLPSEVSSGTVPSAAEKVVEKIDSPSPFASISNPPVLDDPAPAPAPVAAPAPAFSAGSGASSNLIPEPAEPVTLPPVTKPEVGEAAVSSAPVLPPGKPVEMPPPVIDEAPTPKPVPPKIFTSKPAVETAVQEPVREEPVAETLVQEPAKEVPVAEAPVSEPVKQEPVIELPTPEKAAEEPSAPTEEVAGDDDLVSVEDTEVAVAKALRQIMEGLGGVGPLNDDVSDSSGFSASAESSNAEADSSNDKPVEQQVAEKIEEEDVVAEVPTAPIPTPARAKSPRVAPRGRTTKRDDSPSSSSFSSDSASTVPGALLEFRAEEIPDQLELRAVFGVSRRLGIQEVIDHCSDLPGVQACLAISPDEVVKASAQKGARGNESVFYDRAPTIFDSVIRLAGEIGIDDVTILNVKTNSGSNTYFRYGEGCLAVLLDGQPLQDGVREKLIVVARELSSLLP